MKRHIVLAAGIIGAGLLTAAAPALAVDPSALATPGACAEEDRRLRKAPVESARPLARTLLTPTQVGAAPVGPASPLAPPRAPTFPGPGPCDTPGSGCLGNVIRVPVPAFQDTNPSTGCGFPGCVAK